MTSDPTRPGRRPKRVHRWLAAAVLAAAVPLGALAAAGPAAADSVPATPARVIGVVPFGHYWT
jgi:hypothetical protein